MVYYVKCSECQEDYIGKIGRRPYEQIFDHSGKDSKSHMSKLSLKNNHKHVSFEDFPILQNARLELTYCDSINLIQFSIFKIKISPPSQKITIPKYNAVSYSQTEKQNFFSCY